MNGNHRVGVNEVIPIADRSSLSEDSIMVASFRYIAKVQQPMNLEFDSGSDKEEMKEKDQLNKAMEDTKKTKSYKKKAVKFVHTMETSDSPETDKPMKMYIKLKQMSLFPSIY
jgi:hypothetical protein